MRSHSKIDYIQGLRAFAVLSVVFYHYPGGFYLAHSGFSGVDLFFVIAGYVMVYTTRSSDGSLAYVRAFAIKRLCRIWPPYVVATTVILFFRWDADFRNFSSIVKWFIASIALYPLWIVMPIDKPGWTLTFEVWFYFLFGISLFFRSARWIALSLFLAITLVAVPLLTKGMFLFYGDYGYGSHGVQAYLSVLTQPMMWNFLIGVGVGVLHERNPNVPRAYACAGAGAAFLALGYLWTLNQHLHSGIVWGIAYGLLVFSIDRLNALQPIRLPRPIVWLGDASYSIYIFHYLIVLWFETTGQRYFTYEGAVVRMFVLYLVGILAIAVASYELLEKGLSDWIKRKMLLDKDKKALPNTVTGPGAAG